VLLPTFSLGPRRSTVPEAGAVVGNQVIANTESLLMMPSCNHLTERENAGRSNRLSLWVRARLSPFVLTAQFGFLPEAVGKNCPTSSERVVPDPDFDRRSFDNTEVLWLVHE
jgi:hypothetical protein